MTGANKDAERRQRINHEKGRLAENKIAHILSRLPAEEYIVLHNVPARYGDIDHLVFKRGVIIMIETKSCQGRISWDGKQLLLNERPFTSNPICQINRNIRWVRYMAKRIFGTNPWVVSVLVFPNAEVHVKHSVKRVNVLNAKDLLAFITNYKH